MISLVQLSIAPQTHLFTVSDSALWVAGVPFLSPVGNSTIYLGYLINNSLPSTQLTQKEVLISHFGNDLQLLFHWAYKTLNICFNKCVVCIYLYINIEKLLLRVTCKPTIFYAKPMSCRYTEQPLLLSQLSRVILILPSLFLHIYISVMRIELWFSVTILRQDSYFSMAALGYVKVCLFWKLFAVFSFRTKSKIAQG